MKKNGALLLIMLWFFLMNLPFFAQGKINQPLQSVLPIKFNTGNQAPYGLPSTTIMIQGKSLPILFDTGASKAEVTLSAHALHGIHVKFTGTQRCFKALDGKHCEKEFIIPSMRIGNFTLKNVKGTFMSKLWGGHDAGFIETEASKNGVIGYALLSKFNILLDFPHARAILYARNKGVEKNDFSQWVSMPFSGHLHTAVTLNGKNMLLGWDTGSVPSIIKTNAVKKMRATHCPEETPFGKDKNCRRIITQQFKTVAGNVIPKTWFLIRDIPSFAPFDGLMGSNFFMRNLVFLDFDQKIIYLKDPLA